MRHKTVLQPGEHRGFSRGLALVPLGKVPNLRNELHSIIGGTRCKVNYYMNGKTIIREEVAKQIKKAFSRYGIEEDDIFDE